jgi:hypothetical protein
LRPGKFSVHEAKVPDAICVAGEIVSKIKSGVIAPSPLEKKVCRYCTARFMCQGGADEQD